MYYVTAADAPAVKLHEGDWIEMLEWAQRVAARDGRALDVRLLRSGEISGSFDRRGRNIPLREE